VAMAVLIILGMSVVAYGFIDQRTPLDEYASLYDGRSGGEQSGASMDAMVPDGLESDFVDLPDFLLYELLVEQEENGSWEDDIDTTVISNLAISKHTNASADYDLNGTLYTGAEAAGNWTADNYYVGLPRVDGFAPLIIITNVNISLQQTVEDGLLASQNPNGSWNDDVSDTALATYSLASRNGPDFEPALRGMEWIRYMEVEYEWGSVQEDAKSILALDVMGTDLREELNALLSKQNDDGSFGTVEDTAWALMAISTNLGIDTLDEADSAMVWLREQDIDDEGELALAALSEQYYNTAVFDSNVLTEKLGPQSWVYPVIVIVIIAFLVFALLFARIGSEDVMDGVRKDIYDYIADNPGEHLAEITRQFEMSSSSARHHLAVLEWNDKIVSHKEGKHRHYYLNMNGYRRYTNGFEYKKIMSTLKNPTTREIVKYLADNNNSNQKSISEALDIHPSTVNWHAKRLRDARIIGQTRSGKDIIYSLNPEIQLDQVISLIEGASS